MVKILTMEQIQEIKQRYVNGESSEKLALDYPVSSVAIRGILKRRGIKIRDQSHSRQIYNINEDFFEKIDNEEKVYWLGFICADGYLNIERGVLNISISIKDEKYLKRFLSDLKSNHPLRYFETKGYKYIRIDIRNKKLSEDLKRFIKKRKTFSLEFPKIPKELESHFIRGYFDGDGSIYFNRKQNNCSFTITSNIKFLNELKKRLLKIGLNDNKFFVRNKETPEIATLIYSGRNNIKKFYDYLYNNSTIFFERKKLIFEQIENETRNKRGIKKC